MIVISAITRKGGGGKTTAAVNLTAAYAERGLRVALIDSDPTGTAYWWIGPVKDDAGLVMETRVPWKVMRVADGGLLVDTLEALRDGGQVDMVVVDGPPLDAHLTGAIFAASDIVIVPLKPSGLDIQGGGPVLKMIRSSKSKLGFVVLSQVKGALTSETKIRGQLIKADYPVAETSLGHYTAHEASTVAHQPITTFAPESKAAEDIRKLARELWSHLDAAGLVGRAA